MIDIIIIFVILLGTLLGIKRGFTKELVHSVGFIVCIILAFILKNPIASFLYDKLPFFSFGGILKGVTALNILLYEVIAFLLTLLILTLVLGLLKVATSIFEKILNMTIILGIPSKILGGVVALVKWTIICFIALFVLSMPVFENDFVSESKIYDKMLTVVPYFSKQIDSTLKVFDEFNALKEQYKENNNTNQFNLDSLDLFLKYHIIDVESADKLYKKGKFKNIYNIESVLDKYRTETN